MLGLGIGQAVRVRARCNSAPTRASSIELVAAERVSRLSASRLSYCEAAWLGLGLG